MECLALRQEIDLLHIYNTKLYDSSLSIVKQKLDTLEKKLLLFITRNITPCNICSNAHIGKDYYSLWKSPRESIHSRIGGWRCAPYFGCKYEWIYGRIKLGFWLIAQNFATNEVIVLFILRNCKTNKNYKGDSYRNGAIGLGPSGNPIAEKIASYFSNYYGYEIRWFDNNSQINSYARDNDYNNLQMNKTALCLGIMLENYTNDQYSYVLKFNTSDTTDYIELPQNRLNKIDPIKL